MFGKYAYYNQINVSYLSYLFKILFPLIIDLKKIIELNYDFEDIEKVEIKWIMEFAFEFQITYQYFKFASLGDKET